ncbi:Similar to hypothetical protein [Tuber melanosporum Mel28]; acc. no. XP_002838409 [Pyronema omphalodes CBS 100304]|uniref:Uncharacterized protein n=1 Tax=Pyronema omphalodes (strain CBS 100304) TaxID=1076935 RepID=U4LNF7_PYROM|nr:Similar to hypothetical protein [Tuber melanosporum Mel28]; acc. no. XP_002838409 [Pyronema omphalodes CBS 100304]
MVAGRTPSSAWQAVAAKVVSANRKRRGLGKDVRIEDFRVEELGGRAGQSVFGPVSMFNGQVTFRVKKPLKGITVSVTWAGTTEIEGKPIRFISADANVYQGDLIKEGFRSFLFAFKFPHINLPPTSENPLIQYTFQAKLAVDNRPDSKETLPFSHTTEIMEYRTKPLRISFIPYIDPSLQLPPLSKKPSVHKKQRSIPSSPRSSHSAGKRPENRSQHTILSPDSPVGSSSGNRTPKMRGPKLTLTTADLDPIITVSDHSTPFTEKPYISTLSSAITRSFSLVGDNDETIAKLTADLPVSRFLPAEPIKINLTITVNDGVPLPKGLGARIVETRCLVEESPDGEPIEQNPQEDFDEDMMKPPLRVKTVGKEQLRVLTGEKFLLPRVSNTNELKQSFSVVLPDFQTFIADSLLPTAVLPLGDPTRDSESPLTPNTDISGKTDDADLHRVKRAHELYFRVHHLVQITVPMPSGTHWYNTAKGLGELEVTVPIILGNKKPGSTTQFTQSKIRSEIRIFGSDEQTTSSNATPKSKSWVEANYGTLRDETVRPGFVDD